MAVVQERNDPRPQGLEVSTTQCEGLRYGLWLLIEGSLEAKTSDNMDRWKSTARKELRKEESQKSGDKRGRKSEERRCRCAKRSESS